MKLQSDWVTAVLLTLVSCGSMADDLSSRCAADADDTKFVQDLVEKAKGGDGVVRMPPGCFRITKPIVIRNASRGIEFQMLPTSEVEAEIPGDYAFKIANTSFGVFKLNIVITAADGRGVLFESTPTTGNTMYNTLSGRIFGRARNNPGESRKPAQGSGSIGVGFRLLRKRDSGAASADAGTVQFANYFNRIRDLVVRRLDTGIYLASDSNAQFIENVQIEKYWYGIIIHSDENRLVGGFCHHAPGRNVDQQTECIHIGAARKTNSTPDSGPAKTHTSFNQIIGFVGEPGPFARMLVMEGGNRGNYIQIGDNAGSPNMIEPNNHIIRWRSSALAEF